MEAFWVRPGFGFVLAQEGKCSFQKVRGYLGLNVVLFWLRSNSLKHHLCSNVLPCRPQCFPPTVSVPCLFFCFPALTDVLGEEEQGWALLHAENSHPQPFSCAAGLLALNSSRGQASDSLQAQVENVASSPKS